MTREDRAKALDILLGEGWRPPEEDVSGSRSIDPAVTQLAGLQRDEVIKKLGSPRSESSEWITYEIEYLGDRTWLDAWIPGGPPSYSVIRIYFDERTTRIAAIRIVRG